MCVETTAATWRVLEELDTGRGCATDLCHVYNGSDLPNAKTVPRLADFSSQLPNQLYDNHLQRFHYGLLPASTVARMANLPNWQIG
jgi:hypothetical protein